MKKYLIVLFVVIMFSQCKNESAMQNKNADNIVVSEITDEIINDVINLIKEKNGNAHNFRIEKGVNQLASFWRVEDGTIEEFKTFCDENFIADTLKLYNVFMRLSENFEVLNGNFNKISLDLARPLHLKMGEILPIDMYFGAYDVSAHFTEDFFKNKIAMIVALNFPFYSLEEKEKLGENWTREQWAFARMGDKYTSRVPAELLQKVSETTTSADTYISEYNIYMNKLINDEGKALFEEELVLITHWGLRDELKSNYNIENGLEKQKMVYEVMKDIINQDIPNEVINSGDYTWNPRSDKLFQSGKEIEFTKEPNTRYQHLLNNFLSKKEIDKYSLQYPTFIQRKFEKDMEISQEDVEKLFIELVSSPEVKKVAELIKKRLNRDLEPFDIWYNGFRGGNSYSEMDLNKMTKDYYPNPEALKADLPSILIKLGWKSKRAKEISDKIAVDPARGAGHAWGAEMKSDVAHLRTRIGNDGMNYKGYNIAIHEFGHNVEQTITLQDIDYYMLRGVPNTAFTEAIAFIFQKRDLELLGLTENDPDKMHYMALDNFWSCYEIMGVSLVDMNVWKWMYEHPEANAEELKVAVVDIAIDIWNKYYADVFGIKDQPILAVYSHMIDAPLYLSAYPIGYLIDFQIEQYIEYKDFPTEIERILKNGRIIPQLWMKEAVNEKLSNIPLLKATKAAIVAINK